MFGCILMLNDIEDATMVLLDAVQTMAVAKEA